MSQIALPAVVLRAKSVQTLVVSPVTLTSGRTLADWSAFALTVRVDPVWPRKGFREADNVDPYNAWESVLTATGSVVGSTIEFALTAAGTDLPAGDKRYAFDVRGTGGTAGEVPLVSATWLTLLPAVG